MGDEIEINVDTEELPGDNSEDDTTEIVVNDAEVIEENPVEVNVIIEDEDNTAEWEQIEGQLQEDQVAQAVAEATTDLSLQAQILAMQEQNSIQIMMLQDQINSIQSRLSASNPTPAEAMPENPGAESVGDSPPAKRGRRSRTIWDWLT